MQKQLALFFGMALMAGSAAAATIPPPMLDISKQCAAGRRGATAMSECVVAESEARAELLQNWSRYHDDGVEKCWKVLRKAKRGPYGEMSKCLTADAAERAAHPAPPQVASAAPAPVAAAAAAVEAKSGEVKPVEVKDSGSGSGTKIFHKLKSFFSSN